MRHAVLLLVTAWALASYATTPAAAPSTPDDLVAKTTRLAQESIARSGVPGISIAVARDGRPAFSTAVGNARLDPPTPLAPSMPLPIGSVSKQFTAVAVLLLAQDGRLRLDDPAGKHLAGLGPAARVTLRQALAHTGGIRDYWPQDYVFHDMLAPVTSRAILDRWAARPADFEPGTSWQYSNTGYVVAGAVAEKVARKPLFEFLRERVFVPLGMTSVVDVDRGRLGPNDAAGYQSVGLGPARVAPKEGAGWLFAAGGLAMTAEDLVKWDLALAGGKVLRPAMLRELVSESVLRDGTGTQYALGLQVKREEGRRTWSHGGEVSGFCAHNVVYPEQGLAVAVMVNQDNNGVAQRVAGDVARLLLADTAPEASDALAEAREILSGLQQGRIDRAKFTENANAYFSAQALADFRTGLSPLGDLLELRPGGSGLRGGMSWRAYRARFEKRGVAVLVRALPDGKVEQFTVSAE